MLNTALFNQKSQQIDTKTMKHSISILFKFVVSIYAKMSLLFGKKKMPIEKSETPAQTKKVHL